MSNNDKFEVTVKVTLYADTQGQATSEVEKRLTPGRASDDKNALIVHEINTKRAK